MKTTNQRTRTTIVIIILAIIGLVSVWQMNQSQVASSPEQPDEQTLAALSPSQTAIPSDSEKPTPLPSPSPTATATPSPSPTATATPSPSPTPTPTPAPPPVGVIRENNLNVREGPSTDFIRIPGPSLLSKGDKVEVLAKAQGNNVCDIWFEIRLSRNDMGWVCSDYVRLSKQDQEKLPTKTKAEVLQSLIATPTHTAQTPWYKVEPPDIPPPPLRKRFTPQRGDRVRQITPGVIHIHRITDDPLNINILLFDITAPEFDIKTALNDGWLSGRTRTSHLVKQNKALAGINGDLFADMGDPQGLTIIDSEVVIPPKHRATFAWTKDRKPFIGYFTDQWNWDAAVVTEDGERRTIVEFNRICSYDDLCMFNEFNGIVPNVPSGALKVFLDSKGEVIDVSYYQGLKIPEGMRVLQGSGEAAEWLLEHAPISATLDFEVETKYPLEPIAQAISGGPIILKYGTFYQDCLCKLWDCSNVVFDDPDDGKDMLCEDFDTSWKESHYENVYMPRTGIGFDRWRQTLIVIVVDGYQLGFSRGILQEEFADLFLEFGAYTAMELDGGGSSTMVLQDKVVNQPSDNTGERFVANALLFFWDDGTDTDEDTDDETGVEIDDLSRTLTE